MFPTNHHTLAQSHLCSLLLSYFSFFTCTLERWFRNLSSLFPCFFWGKIRAESYVWFHNLGLWNVVGAWLFGCVLPIKSLLPNICFPAHPQNGDEQKYSFGPNIWKRKSKSFGPKLFLPTCPTQIFDSMVFLSYVLQPIFWIYNVVTMQVLCFHLFAWLLQTTMHK